MGSSLSESRVSAFPRFPGSKGLPGTPSPAGSRRQPKCVVDSITEGSPASLPKSFKPASFSRRDSHVRGQQEDAELGLRYDRGLVSALAIDGDGKAKLPEHSRSVSRPFEADEFRTSSLIVTDGFKFYQKVIRRFFGPACLYGQVLKTRRNDRIIKVERRALHGAAWRFEGALNNSEDSSTLNTSFIERLNLTIRQSSAYLSRRTLSHARSTERLDEHLELLRCYYNFVRPHGALKFGREIRTPAMQAGLTTRRLTFRDIFLATTIPLWSRIEVFLLTGARNPVSSAPVPLPAAA